MRNYTRNSWHCKHTRRVRESEYGIYVYKPDEEKGKGLGWIKLRKLNGDSFYEGFIYSKVHDEK